MQIITIEIFDTSEVFELPCAFKYTRFIPPKRISVKTTAKGAFTQVSNPPFVYEGNTFNFALDGAVGTDAQFFNNLYKNCTKFYINGVLGERYLVQISEFDAQPFGNSIYVITGKMLILCVEAEPDFGICPGSEPDP